MVTGAGVFVGTGVFVGGGVTEAVAVAVAVAVLVGVGLGATVGVFVGSGVLVAVAVGGIGVFVGAGVFSGVGVGDRLVVMSAAKVPRLRAAVLRPLICSVCPLVVTLAAASQQLGLPVPVQSAVLITWRRACWFNTSALQAALSSTGTARVQVAVSETGPRGKIS